jgi:hypothetical protein
MPKKPSATPRVSAGAEGAGAGAAAVVAGAGAGADGAGAGAVAGAGAGAVAPAAASTVAVVDGVDAWAVAAWPFAAAHRRVRRPVRQPRRETVTEPRHTTAVVAARACHRHDQRALVAREQRVRTAVSPARRRREVAARTARSSSFFAACRCPAAFGAAVALPAAGAVSSTTRAAMEKNRR